MIDITKVILYMTPALILAVLVLIFYAMKMVRMTREINEYKLDKYRLDIETQIAKLANQLVINDERFKQVNHLLISGQARTQSDILSEKVKPNEFLQKMGVDPEQKVQSNLVFVLIPFNPDFDETYSVIKEVVQEAGFHCTRGDASFVSGEILPDIIQNIVKARLIIADITGRNPNVFYELGIAHAIGKQVLILSKVERDIPFDVASIRVLTYEDSNDLRNRLRNWIVQTLAKFG